MQTPKFQNIYGQGVDGKFDNNKTDSWGAVMDGSMKDMAMGNLPYAARDNDLYSDFYKQVPVGQIVWISVRVLKT